MTYRPKDDVPWIPILGGLGVLLLLTRKSETPQQAPAPSPAPNPNRPVPSPVPAPVPVPGPAPRVANRYGQAPPSQSLTDRLYESASARHIFAIQSLGYSARMTDEPPTGLVGASLSRIMDGARILYGVSLGSDQASLRRFATILRLHVRNPRLQPMWLPTDLQVQINRYIGYDPANASASAVMPLQTYGP